MPATQALKARHLFSQPAVLQLHAPQSQHACLPQTHLQPAWQIAAKLYPSTPLPHPKRLFPTRQSHPVMLQLPSGHVASSSTHTHQESHRQQSRRPQLVPAAAARAAAAVREAAARLARVEQVAALPSKPERHSQPASHRRRPQGLCRRHAELQRARGACQLASQLASHRHNLPPRPQRLHQHIVPQLPSMPPARARLPGLLTNRQPPTHRLLQDQAQVWFVAAGRALVAPNRLE